MKQDGSGITQVGVVPPAGLEPAARGLGIGARFSHAAPFRSIQVHGLERNGHERPIMPRCASLISTTVAPNVCPISITEVIQGRPALVPSLCAPAV